MNHLDSVTPGERRRALGASTIAFTACFAVWTIFSIIGIQIKNDLGLNDTQFGLLIGTPILTGSITRIALGIWTDQFGGRLVYAIVMLAAAAATFALSFATSFEMMLAAALGVGVAGGSFAVGVAYVSRWFPLEKQGAALGLFGLGNVGTAVTHLFAPLVLIAYGWTAVAQIWAAGLLATALLFWITAKDDPLTVERRRRGAPPFSLASKLAPLRRQQVWRFSLYYFFTFGSFVALALWLPRYYIDVYGLTLAQAGLVATVFSLIGSVFRALGGALSDKYGARTVMYAAFAAAVITTFILSYPYTEYAVAGISGEIRFAFGIGFIPFLALTTILGFFLSLGSAAVFKHIPTYYPDNVGAVGGLVGMIGALGGFLLPITFGVMNDLLNVWTSCFMLLFALVATAMIWMHFAIQNLERRKNASLRGPKDLPELEEAIEASRHAAEAVESAARALRKARNLQGAQS